MSTTNLPAFKFPNTAAPAVDNGRKLNEDVARWMQGIDRAVRRLLAGVNGVDGDAAQAEADAQTAITNAAAAQATANAALPKAGGTMTGPIVGAHYTVATLPAGAAYGEAWISDGSTAYPTGAGGAPTGGGANKRKVYYDGSAWLLF